TEGGTLTLETSNVTSLGEDDVPAGDYVLLCVTDTGVGMTAEVLERAVEPFFTTKNLGHGTGLGLSMVYGFVKQSGGNVKIESAPNQGTRVRLYLPRSEVATQAANAASETEAAGISGRDRTILLVEDDAGVRAVTAAMLKELQFTVIEADSGSHALDIVDAQPNIDLLFTDIVMPGMNGFELGRLARERRPQLPVLYATGYSASYTAPEKGADVLAKPYREADLAMKLRVLLTGQGSRAEARPAAHQ
ncbi:MAG TPA: response regulator, partial [Steroidobacteraceae bacterium]|nr:response regulator [Steroidobacteraceae bacterium]